MPVCPHRPPITSYISKIYVAFQTEDGDTIYIYEASSSALTLNKTIDVSSLGWTGRHIRHIKGRYLVTRNYLIDIFTGQTVGSTNKVFDISPDLQYVAITNASGYGFDIRQFSTGDLGGGDLVASVGVVSDGLILQIYFGQEGQIVLVNENKEVYLYNFDGSSVSEVGNYVYDAMEVIASTDVDNYANVAIGSFIAGGWTLRIFDSQMNARIEIVDPCYVWFLGENYFVDLTGSIAMIGLEINTLRVYQYDPSTYTYSLVVEQSIGEPTPSSGIAHNGYIAFNTGLTYYFDGTNLTQIQSAISGIRYSAISKQPYQRSQVIHI